MKKIDLAFIGNSEVMKKRCSEIATTMNLSFDSCESVDELSDREATFSNVTFILLSATDVQNKNDIAGMVQVLRQTSPSAYCTLAVDSKVDPDSLSFIKKSGANLLLLGPEIEHSSKLDFAVSQIVKASYLPIKVAELALETQLRTPLFHLLPLNRKFLPYFKSGDRVSQERLDHLKGVSELYIKRDDIKEWEKYTEETMDKSASGLAARCRSQFMGLSRAYCDLVLMVSDQSEFTSFDVGRTLYQSCESLAWDLLTNLSALGNAWDVVSQSAIFSVGPIERAPAVACYAGLLALQSGFENASQIMIASLISDIGLLDGPPKLMQKLGEGQLELLSAEELDFYKRHPIIGLHLMLGRKLPIPESMKEIILCTHERADQKGFPNRPRTEKIPKESFLIQLCEDLDRASLVRMGEARVPLHEIKSHLVDQEIESGKKIPSHLLLTLKKQILSA